MAETVSPKWSHLEKVLTVKDFEMQTYNMLLKLLN